jgi:hypothetical protein
MSTITGCPRDRAERLGVLRRRWFERPSSGRVDISERVPSVLERRVGGLPAGGLARSHEKHFQTRARRAPGVLRGDVTVV